MPTTGSVTHVRLADGAPALEALVNGTPAPITPAYVKINGNIIAGPGGQGENCPQAQVCYGTITSFTTAPSGTLSVTALGASGYSVGPLQTPPLTAGGHYTLVIVGSYPNYQVLAFAEPAASTSAQISLYEAAPSVRRAAFGSFTASTGSNFKQLGTARYGTVTTVTLGKSVTDIGGYVGKGPCSNVLPFNCVTPAQVNTFDTNNALPFQAASRLSLFLFDAPPSSATQGPVFGSLDK